MNSAKLARTPSGSGAPKVAAEGVLSALHPDLHTVTVTGIRPGLEIRGLDRGDVPVADWLCSCGWHERARGRKAVIELTARVHVGHCPHRTPETDRKTAA
ncbi:hypothetical protein CP981_21255 [Streptomyces platensis]|uniref:Uncharacterized protein n=1 Tax=Streptomyces platensis TaxID=58346 RepID=A0AAE6NR38_STRPT|nr:hypothetical protein CP981_21255 [Streptomyces platensis]